MPTQKPSYGSSTAVTATALATLANSNTAGWQSAAIDNSSTLALRVMIYLQATLASGSPANDKSIYVFVYESEDGTNYTDNATGSAGLLTRRDPTNLRLLGTISTPDSGALTYKAVFGYEPVARKWGIYINNFTGLAFTAAAISYTPVQAQSV